MEAGGVRTRDLGCAAPDSPPRPSFFAASGAQVETTLEVSAEASEAGIPRETLDLTILEGDLLPAGVDRLGRDVL